MSSVLSVLSSAACISGIHASVTEKQFEDQQRDFIIPVQSVTKTLST